MKCYFPHMTKKNLSTWTVFSLIAVLALGGCSERATGVLRAQPATASGGTHIPILVATTRQADSSSPDELFNGERGPRMAFADITISIPPDENRQIGEVQWPVSFPGDPTREFVSLRADTIDLATARARFTERLRKPGVKGRALIFVHGFNNRFDDAVLRFAQIVHDSKAPAVPVLFAWPSRGSIFAYAYDRESANYSRDALASILQALSDNPNVTEIGILAHSMGNWVTLEALRTMSLKHGRVHPKIRDVMLAAPDVDVDVFRTQIAVLGKPAPRMTLFVSQDDQALRVSRRLWGDLPRLGAIDPKAEPYSAQLAAAGITVVDLTALKTGDSLAHGKFAESPEVVRFIGARLASGQQITEARSSLSERLIEGTSDVGSALGGIAARVITAPVAIVESAGNRRRERP
jgi:esterase/lipase superfamily enzyme